jgi:hypothetical protein
MPQEHFGEGDLLGAQLDDAVTDRCSPRTQIKGDPARLQYRRARRRTGAEAKANAGQQLFEAKRLGHMIVRSTLQTGHGRLDVVPAREDHHRWN